MVYNSKRKKTMKALYFLIIGKNHEILQTLQRVIEKNESWKATLCTGEEESYGQIRENKPDLVFLSSGLEQEAEARIRAFCRSVSPEIKVIDHYGGGSGLVKSEVESCFAKPLTIGNPVIHRAGSRGKTDLGWLLSEKTFSFGDYYDPQRIQFGALRVLNDDTVEAGRGFGVHPHDNMEIVSIALQGTLIHEDNLGNMTEIRSGDIQVMSAGTGVTHSEFSKDEGDTVRFLQIWVYPRMRNVAPRYDQLTVDRTKSKNRFQQILSPDPDDEGVWIHQDAWFHLGSFKNNTETSYRTRKEGNGIYIFVIEGSLEVEGETLERRDGFGIREVSELKMKMVSEGTEVLVMEVSVTI